MKMRFGMYKVVDMHLDVHNVMAMSYADALNLYAVKSITPAIGVCYEDENTLYALDDNGKWSMM